MIDALSDPMRDVKAAQRIVSLGMQALRMRRIQLARRLRTPRKLLTERQQGTEKQPNPQEADLTPYIR